MTQLNEEPRFSDKTCRELSALLERSWQTIRNGQSDLRPIERQIKGIFKKELITCIKSQNTQAYQQGYDDRTLEADHEREELLNDISSKATEKKETIVQDKMYTVASKRDEFDKPIFEQQPGSEYLEVIRIDDLNTILESIKEEMS